MLLYNPTFDAKHCAYRFLSVLHLSNGRSFQWEAFKLIDLYRLYPTLLPTIKPFPRELSRVKKLLKSWPKQYTIPSDPRKTLYQIQPIHNLVANWLIAKGFLSKERFESGIVTRTELNTPEGLLDLFAQDTVINSKWFQAFIEDLPNAAFEGPSGLKQRTGYMEFRYDPR